MKDHPRSRGEYVEPSNPIQFVPGSSPLSRGILTMTRLFKEYERIIPALAGNTPQGAILVLWAGDHPRSRGEYQSGSEILPWPVGSSPLSRGIRQPLPRGILLRGIIPALAGNTPHPVGVPRHVGDHPRSRGEYGIPCDWRSGVFGSSPLSRGIQGQAVYI